MSADTSYRPRWIKDLRRFLPLKSQFVLYGNVRDMQVIQTDGTSPRPAKLGTALITELQGYGYRDVIVFNQIEGFSVDASDQDELVNANRILTDLGLTPSNGRAPGGIALLHETLPKIVEYTDAPIALLIDFASRLVIRHDSLSETEQSFFTQCQLVSQQASPRPHGPEARPFFNTIVWIVDRESDLPDWFLVGNPAVRQISIAKPDHIARRAVATGLLRSMPGAVKASEADLKDAEDQFVDETEGMLLADLKAITQLGREEAVSLQRIGEAVRRYKVGVTEDPWQKIDRIKIANAESFIKSRVKGQAHAVTHMLDIIKRAITGVGTSKRGGRPRGVAFLAGPTGVGKTELAKTITSLLFGDESAYIRFDMSEFSAEHSDQRLIGAPPGYVGYDEGGELTNAIREKPFSVVLFDEIEKAHPRILDKFLQVLDDGVLTSGRGDRVYFSEALIIFTSNLGIYKRDASGERVQNVSFNDEFPVVKKNVLGEIDSYFKFVLNRPEILNRLGDNLIVFDFIRPDVAKLIFEQMVGVTLNNVRAEGVDILIEEAPKKILLEACLADLSNGGRGIRNKLEIYLVNPLARVIFEVGAASGTSWKISKIVVGEVVSINLEQVV